MLSPLLCECGGTLTFGHRSTNQRLLFGGGSIELRAEHPTALRKRPPAHDDRKPRSCRADGELDPPGVAGLRLPVHMQAAPAQRQVENVAARRDESVSTVEQHNDVGDES